MDKDIKNKKILSDEEIRKIVKARLSILSPDTIISFGSDGAFSRDELVDKVEKGDDVGEKWVEVQLEWLRSFKDDKLYENYPN